ncbi:hypothetical protein ACMFMG_007809 [Clarireedia jacksonii]
MNHIYPPSSTTRVRIDTIMRPNTSTSALFAWSSFFFLSSGLPFSPRDVVNVRRATYSVVDVDGGSAKSTSGNAVVKTVTQTEKPITKTIIETDKTTLPASTNHVVSTQTVKGSDKTETIVITITPSSSPTTIISYSVVDVTVPVTIVKTSTATPTPTPTPASTSSSTSPVITSSASTTSSLSSTESSSDSTVESSTSVSTSTAPSASITTPVVVPTTVTNASTTTTESSTTTLEASTSFTAPIETSSSAASSSDPVPSLTSTVDVPSALPTVTTSTFSNDEPWYTSYVTTSLGVPTSSPASTSTYDNGQWHTTYPSWNSTVTRRQ